MDQNYNFGGREFKLNKLDAIRQFHIARRVAPILAELVPSLQKAQPGKDADKLSQKEMLDVLSSVVTPVMHGLSKLSDSDADYVLYGLLSCVEMKQPIGNWSKISTTTMLMFHDLELKELLNLASKAFMYNLAGFFNGLPQ